MREEPVPSSQPETPTKEWTALDGSLTIRFLQYINAKRAVRWHQNGGIKSWSALEWAGAMAGEAGEACNAAKKLKRIEDQIANINLEEGRSLTDEQNASSQVVDEIVDTVIYGVLLAERVGLDLEEAIRMKFNKKSEEYGFPERIPLNQPPAVALPVVQDEAPKAALQRYERDVVSHVGGHYGEEQWQTTEMVPCETGAWVKWREVAALMVKADDGKFQPNDFYRAGLLRGAEIADGMKRGPWGDPHDAITHEHLVEQIVAAIRSAADLGASRPSPADKPECDCDGGEQGDGLCALPHAPTCPVYGWENRPMPPALADAKADPR